MLARASSPLLVVIIIDLFLFIYSCRGDGEGAVVTVFDVSKIENYHERRDFWFLPSSSFGFFSLYD
jgi:hypothetical protein